MMMQDFQIIFVICVLGICAVESYGVSTERIQMNDGNWMPATAFGTFVSDYNDRKRIPQATVDAIEAGYRHIDTAFSYLTEDIVGEAIANVTSRGIVKREDLFITTKLSYTVGCRAQVVPAVKKCLKRLKTDFVDLYLIHTPSNVLGIEKYDTLEVWKGLEDAKRLGLTRSIGLSNFNSSDMARILANSETLPAVNQIETNPTFANLELVAYCQSKNILVVGYSPFGFLVPRPYNDLSLPPTFDDPILLRMSKKYGVAVSQIILRCLVDRHIVPIAASWNKHHMELNLDIFRFSISPKDILILNQFDRNVKVFLIDYEGLFAYMRAGFDMLKRYVRRHNLRLYENI